MKTLLKLSLFLLCAHANAAVYKWVDANGEVNYSTTPPAHIDAQKVKVAAPPPSSNPAPVNNAPAEKAQNAQPDANAKDANAAQDVKTNAASNPQAALEAKKAAEEEAKLKEINCNKAKAHLTSLQSKPRMRLKEGGQETALTNEQLAEEIKVTEAHIKRFCGEGK